MSKHRKDTGKGKGDGYCTEHHKYWFRSRRRATRAMEQINAEIRKAGGTKFLQTVYRCWVTGMYETSSKPPEYARQLSLYRRQVARAETIVRTAVEREDAA